MHVDRERPDVIIAGPRPYEPITSGWAASPASPGPMVSCPGNSWPPCSSSRSPGRRMAWLARPRVRQAVVGEVPAAASLPDGLT